MLSCGHLRAFKRGNGDGDPLVSRDRQLVRPHCSRARLFGPDLLLHGVQLGFLVVKVCEGTTQWPRVPAGKEPTAELLALD